MQPLAMFGPMQAVDPTAQRAFAINLDDSIYGDFAEIGAGQEVARWFFAVGGAATGLGSSSLPTPRLPVRSRGATIVTSGWACGSSMP